jgi:hypothetical protein
VNQKRATYTIVLRALPGVDPVRALRRGLKLLLRVCGLRALAVSERREQDEREAA